MGSNYIGRQPIVNQRGGLIAYDLFHSPKHGNEFATELLVNSLHGTFGLDRILGKRIGFVRADHRFIRDELVNLLPKEKVVYVLLEETDVNEILSEQIQKFSTLGYGFGLNDFAFTPENMEKFAPLFPYMQYVKVDISRSGRIKRSDVEAFQRHGIKVVGSKIESHDIHAECVAKGFDYFQGFFISKPRILENDSFALNHEAVISLWNMLQRDVSIDELVKAFELNHTVSLKLLRFINSAVFSLRNPVSSIRHVLTLLGREPLANWVMLLMYSEAQESDQNTAPLLLMVVNRTELMVKLLELVVPKATKSQHATAYFVGMLSLIHLLFNIPHREALRRLNVAPEIERACFEGDGFYGELLTMVRSIEILDGDAIEAFLSRHNLVYAQLEPIIAAAMEKVNQFDAAMG